MSFNVIFYEDQPFYPPISFPGETTTTEWHWDPTISLPMPDPINSQLPVCSQGGESASTPKNTRVASPEPLVTCITDPKNLTIAPKTHLPALDNHLLGYSKQHKDYQEP